MAIILGFVLVLGCDVGDLDYEVFQVIGILAILLILESLARIHMYFLGCTFHSQIAQHRHVLGMLRYVHLRIMNLLIYIIRAKVECLTLHIPLAEK